MCSKEEQICFVVAVSNAIHRVKAKWQLAEHLEIASPSLQEFLALINDDVLAREDFVQLVVEPEVQYEPIVDSMRRAMCAISTKKKYRILAEANSRIRPIEETVTWLRQSEATKHVDPPAGRMNVVHIGSHDSAVDGAKAGPETIGVRMPAPAAHLQAEVLLKLWLAGVPVQWNALLQGLNYSKVPLPLYQFDRQRYWVEAKKERGRPEIAGRDGGSSDVFLHPLVQWNTSTPGQLHFTSTFDGREFFLSDHKVEGCSVLPGVAYLEMVRKALELATGTRINTTSGLCFTSVVWVQPIKVAGTPQTVYIRLNPNRDQTVGYEIYSNSESSPGMPVLHGQGSVIVRALDSIPRLDLGGLQQATKVYRLDSSELYKQFRNGGIDYGSAHQGVREMFIGASQALARIALPSSVAVTAGDYFLHPSIVDSALQAAIATQMIGSRSSTQALEENWPWQESPIFPFSLDSVEIFAGTETAMWAFCRLQEDRGRNPGQLRSLDIDLCDQSGNICMRFKGLSVRTGHENHATFVKRHKHPLSEVREPASVPIVAKPVWTCFQPALNDQSIDKSSRVLVFGANEQVLPTIEKVFPNARFAETAGDCTEPAVIERLGGYRDIDHVVWFAADQPAGSVSDQALISAQRSGVLGLFHLVKALLQQGNGLREISWTICTTRTQEVQVGDRVDPTNAAIHGLAGCMAKEFPHWRVRLIDLECVSSESVAKLLRLPYDGSGKPVADRQGQWFRRELLPIREFSTGEKLLKKNGVYVVIGGAGGIGEEWSRWLIERYQAQMIWIGRREKDSSIQQKLDALEAIGPAPYYIPADAADRESLRAAYDQIKSRFSKINGVVHSAIVLKDGSLANMTSEQFTTSLAANVDVCVRIAQVFNQEALDFVLFFSSIQSFCTFGGQSNYAAGCTFKDAFANRLRQDWSCAVKVVNWGYWGSVGVVSGDFYRDSMALRGFGSIEPADGFEPLERLINSPMDQAAIVKTLRSGVVDGFQDEEFLTTVAARGVCSDSQNWLPRTPQLTAALDDGGLILPGLTQILGKVLWGTVQALGFCGRNQAPVSAIKDAIDASGRYQRWVDESLAILERQNYLQVDGDICFATDPTLVRMDEVWTEWNTQKERYLSNPDTRPQIVLLDACLRNVQEILTGRLSATDVIFSDSSPELAGGIYKNNRTADYFNNALASIVKAYIEELAKSDASSRYRIFEIGAGTGGTTASILSLLEPLKERIEEYCFTDVSTAFLNSAHEQFGRKWSSLIMHRFDVEKPLAEQAIPSGHYDVVVAANALHATRDIHNTLRNAKATLRKDGLLVLNELSANSLFLHLTFGLLQGWWLYKDSSLRIPGSPGLYPETWRSVLGNEGFRSIVFPAAQAGEFGQQIIVAQSDGVIRQRRSTSPAHESFSETKAPPKNASPSISRSRQVERGIEVPDQMIEKQVKTIVRESIAASLKMDEGEIQDGRVFSDYGVDSIIGVQLINQINQRCNIVIPTTALFDYNNVNELSAFVIKQFASTLVSSLSNRPIANSPQDRLTPVVFASGEMFCQRVVIERPGQINDIQIAQSALPMCGRHEVRIAVRATSLNFADLLCVKGLYPNMPDYPFTPGIEASGVVVAVGDSVRSVAVGESVVVFMGEGLGAHATVITCSEECVLKKPENLSFEQACSLPAAAVTMVYAFRKAHLRRGEKILIQTATAATGLVAVQLAQYYGAEVYATAGSSEKLDYLRTLGVPHGINYLQTDFASEIERLTQGRGVDVVINTLPGDAIQKGLNCLASGGRYVEVAMTALKSARAIDLSVLNNNQSFYSVDLLRLATAERQTFIDCYNEMIELVSRGVVRPTISQIIPFDRIKEGYEYLEQRSNIGKIVISVPEQVTWPQVMPVSVKSSSDRKMSAAAVPTTLEPIAIVGLSGRFAKSPSVQALWKHLANGDDLVDEVTRWDLLQAYSEGLQDPENRCFAGGLLEDIDKFDPSFFDISALEAIHMDPQQRLFLEEAWKALEDAGYAGAPIEGRNCAVYVGCTAGDYCRLLPKSSPAHSFWGNAGSVIPARIAYYLNLRGPAVAIDTACSSSLVAIHTACESLRAHETELALAGGVFVLSTADFYLSASRAGMLSPKGHCHAFDERADGFVPGEGVGVIVLKRLNDAIKDGDHLYGVIRGSGLNQDGKTNGLTAPSANSQLRLERQVYEKFSIHPERIQMVEAHGTGTRLGDPIEFEALTHAFGKDTQRKEFCAIGSIKSNLGHAATAAGIAGVLKILLSLQHKKIPPTLHFVSGNPSIRFADSPFYVNTELKEWDISDGRPRCAAVSSFGFSGTNAHMVIEEAPAVERSHGARPAYLIVLSARTSGQLQQQAEQLVQFCGQHPQVDVGNISCTLLVGRRHWNHRLVTMVQDSHELVGYLQKWLNTRHVLQVQVSEIDEDQNQEDPSLREFGNECIRTCSSAAERHVYLSKLATVAKLFAQGYRLEFAELFARDGYSKISLPTYPFSQERYWVELDASPRLVASSRVLHPMVQQNCSTLGAQMYRSEFTGGEFFLADHQLDGKRLMPAVAYLEMAVAAAAHALSEPVAPGRSSGSTTPFRIQLKNVVWSTPLTVGTKKETLVIRLMPRSGTTIEYEVTNDNRNEASHLTYCQGTLDTGSFESPPAVDLLSINRVDPAATVIGAGECYDAFQAMGIQYGPSHRGLESISISGDLAIAKLRLPASAKAEMVDYVLHPSVMDAALQATIAFFAPSKLFRREADSGVSTSVQLPYAVDEVTVHRPTERHMRAMIRFSRAGVGHRVTKLDIDICNEEGVVCVGLRGLSLRDTERVSRVSDGRVARECLFFQPRLELKPALLSGPDSEYTGHWLILLNVKLTERGVLDARGMHLEVVNSGPTDRIDQYFETCMTRIIEVVQGILQARLGGKKLLQIVICPGDGHTDVVQTLSALSAVVRTIRQEDPTLVAQLIEVGPSETEISLSEKITENSRCPQDQVVVYRKRQRHVAGWQETTVPPHREMPWRENGIYLITGGAGGLGQIFAREICSHAKNATVVVAGRSVLSGTHLSGIEDIRARGMTVHYRQTDVSRKNSVDALISWIREEFGQLNGVLHGAGILRDGLCLRKTAAEVRDVLAPKVAGLVNLDLATGDMPLDFFVCFSSVAGAIGNAGQIDYAGANAFMDAFAHYRSALVATGKRHGRTLSINWPLWKDSGLFIGEDTADRLFHSFGMTAMTAETGIQAFYQCYAAGSSQVMVLSGNNDRIRQVINNGLEIAKTTEQPALVSSSKSLREEATSYLRQVIASVLQFPVERIKDTDPFERYGIDSILALKLTNELEKTFGSLSKILFFEHQNLRSLSDYFIENHRTQLMELGSEHGTSSQTPAQARVLPERSEGRVAPAPQQSVLREPLSTGGLDIAIIGLSGRYPGARTMNEFWENLKAGKDCISEIPSDRWDYRRYFNADKTTPGTVYSKWGGFIDGVDEFDPLFFNISPREAELLDPQERLFLQCAYETIEDSGYTPITAGGPNNSPGKPANVGVFVGVMYEEYQLFGVEETIKGRPIALPGNPASIANRVSYFCDFSGPCMVVDTMCSSSLTAIHLACQSLSLGECTAAIAGGVNVSIHPNKYLLLSQGRFASSAGRCESFGVGGDGYVPGEGVGAVLLKPLSMALRDGDHIYGVIKGMAVNHGGKTNGFTVPNPNAQSAMISRAIKQAGIRPREISYVEAHGTGTSLGDPIEIAGLTQAFRADTAERQFCAIGSLKSNIGHCESAAGIGGVSKVLVQLKHKQLVPSLHSRTLNPLIDFSNGPFRVQQEVTDWNQPVIAFDGESRQVPRTAGISSFGAGGSNAHLVIQEFSDGEDPLSERAQAAVDHEVIIVLSARTKERLTLVVSNLYGHLKMTSQRSGSGAVRLTSLAYTLQVGRVAMEERLAFIVKSYQELEEKLQSILLSGELPGVFRGNINHTDNTVSMMRQEGDLDQIAAKWMKTGRLAPLAQMWVNGLEIEWNALYDSPRPRRVSLPAYPFARERYWVPSVGHVTSQSEPASDPMKILTKDWRPKAISALRKERAGSVVVLGTSRTSALVSKLFTDRADIQIVEVLQECASPAISTDFYSSVTGESLYLQLQQRLAGTPLLGVIDCTALDAGYGQQSLEVGKIRFIQLLIEHEARQGFKLLQLTSRLYPFQSPTTTLRGASMAGLYRMISAEYRKVDSIVMDADLDVSESSKLAAQIQHEFWNHNESGMSECCYRDGIRYEPCLVTANYSADSNRSGPALSRISPDDVFMVTGGTRGIGAAVAEYLVSCGARRLVLLGREQFPSPAMWKSIAKANVQTDLGRKLELLLAMIDKGVRVSYFNTSLTDSLGLQEMLHHIHTELGSISGVFHCAGLSGENPAFVKKATREIETVCEPKVHGLIELHRALEKEPLQCFVLFSSVASAIPSLAAGQSDYAMANAFMDFYASHQASQGQTIFKSVQWPAWSETGMAVGKVNIPSYTRTGLMPLTTADGMRFIEFALNSELTVFMPGRMKPIGFEYSDLLSTNFSGIANRKAGGTESIATPNPATPQSSSASERRVIAMWLREIFMSELKLSEEQLQETRRFDEYGVDSVMIAQLVQIMQRRVRATLSPALLLEYSSVAALTDYFLSAHSRDFADPENNTVVGRDTTAPATDDQSAYETPTRSTRTEEDNSMADIAVVGISCRFPGGFSKAEYWNELAIGDCAIGQMRDPRWKSADERFLHGGWLEDIDSFDPGYFNLSEQDAAVMDPQARLLLEESLSALFDAGYDPKTISGEKVGVYVGGRSSMSVDMNTILKAPNPILGAAQNYLATNISRFFNFAGPSVVIDTGCSSAITGMLFASDALRSKRITMAMVGGVSLLLTPDAHRLFAERKILSESGEFRIFDRQATGEVLGEGAGIVILRRLQDAIADGNQIYGVIKAISMNNDGRTLGPGSPNINAQKQVMIEALHSAGIGPEDVGYIEVNGGGSPVVDAVEIKALSDVYRLDDRNLRSCFLGSVKPNIGHLLLVSGLAGFIRCVLSVYYKQIPPFLSATDLFEYYDFSASRIRFNREAVSWEVASGEKRIAAQNSYPDGGTNGHILVEEFVPEESYRQRLFSKPQPFLKRSRFPLSPVSTPRTSVAVVTRMAKADVVSTGMSNFLEIFEDTRAKEEPNGWSDHSTERSGSIKTAWGEYDEESI
jgi:acyl transferase domain-containing protein/D-arabinose 1-dehydrogenase-like Zn-dependent alcohol dehydrogenase/acyl carrier protein/SAM-dependent methyltransferase